MLTDRRRPPASSHQVDPMQMARGRNQMRTKAARIAAALRRCYEHLLLYAILLAFAVITFLWSISGALLARIVPARRAVRLGPWLVMMASRFFLLLMRATGKVTLDLAELDLLRDAGPLIIAPNHPSLLDAVLVIARLPRIVCLTKATLFDSVLLGGGMRFAGYIRNDAPLRMVKDARARLRQGSQILLFPEGTRTTRQPINPLKPSFALIAKQAGVPVQAVFIEANTRFLGKDWPLLKLPPLPLVYRVRLGRRFEVSGDIAGFTTMLEDYFAAESRR